MLLKVYLVHKKNKNIAIQTNNQSKVVAIVSELYLPPVQCPNTPLRTLLPVYPSGSLQYKEYPPSRATLQTLIVLLR